MKLFITILILISSRAFADDIYLQVGGNHKLKINASERIRIKGQDILKAKDLGSYLVITGIKVGVAEVQTPTQNHKIYVVETQVLDFLSKLNLLLEQFLDLSAELSNGQIHLRGQLHRLRDWQQIYELANQNNASFVMSAQLDDDLHGPTRKWVQDEFSRLNFQAPHLTLDYGVTAHFSEELNPLNTNVTSLLNTLGLKITFDKSQIDIQPLIRVKIIVAEVNKTMQSQLGVHWPESIAAQVLPSLKGPSSLEVMLNALEQKGHGQILASPNLLARSGSEADFLAGGEFAIKIISPRMRDVIWKKHGISLKIKPKADRTGRISVELATEVSIIDASQTVDGIPGLKTNRMATHFDLVSSRTIALSGLIRRDWGQNQSGVMGLSDIPIIGRLFRSDNFMNNKTELVIFVTPEIVDTSSESNKEKLPDSWIKND